MDKLDGGHKIASVGTLDLFHAVDRMGFLLWKSVGWFGKHIGQMKNSCPSLSHSVWLSWIACQAKYN